MTALEQAANEFLDQKRIAVRRRVAQPGRGGGRERRLPAAA